MFPVTLVGTSKFLAIHGSGDLIKESGFIWRNNQYVTPFKDPKATRLELQTGLAWVAIDGTHHCMVALQFSTKKVYFPLE